MEQKLQRLRDDIARTPRAAVAFSAGVDSLVLLAVAHQVLGDGVVAFTACSPAFPAEEIEEARAFCSARGIAHVLFDLDEMQIEGFDRNPEQRCYLCKASMFDRIIHEAASLGISRVLDGSNFDDLGEHRPGRSAILERGVASPLAEAGFTKEEVRRLARALGLEGWDKPSQTCAYTRFPYGEHLSSPKVARVVAAEDFLHEMGFPLVRVRSHGDDARIEVPMEDIQRAADPETFTAIEEELRKLGFAKVTLDERGYRSGSMDEGRYPR